MNAAVPRKRTRVAEWLHENSVKAFVKHFTKVIIEFLPFRSARTYEAFHQCELEYAPSAPTSE